MDAMAYSCSHDVDWNVTVIRSKWCNRGHVKQLNSLCLIWRERERIIAQKPGIFNIIARRLYAHYIITMHSWIYTWPCQVKCKRNFLRYLHGNKVIMHNLAAHGLLTQSRPRNLMDIVNLRVPTYMWNIGRCMIIDTADKRQYTFNSQFHFIGRHDRRHWPHGPVSGFTFSYKTDDKKFPCSRLEGEMPRKNAEHCLNPAIRVNIFLPIRKEQFNAFFYIAIDDDNILLYHEKSIHLNGELCKGFVHNHTTFLRRLSFRGERWQLRRNEHGCTLKRCA